MAHLHGFPGFPAGKLRQTRIPNLFFSDLLPIIDDLAELKLALYCFWQLGQRSGELRYLRRADLAQDAALMSALEGGADALDAAIERALARGTLLRVYVHREGQIPEEWLFLNTARSREFVAQIESGELPDLEGIIPPDTVARLRAERPNIFNLYEQNIGMLQPLIADELREAERAYPGPWLEDAFRQAVRMNKRNWRYVQAILQRWAAEGRDDGIAGQDSDEARRRRYVPDGYADLIKH
jgi:DnaD/phage-associated family protein